MKFQRRVVIGVCELWAYSSMTNGYESAVEQMKVEICVSFIALWHPLTLPHVKREQECWVDV